MNWMDYTIIGIVLLILGAAAFAIYRSKKSGRKCIGCPDSATCPSSKQGTCSCHHT